ncbi:ABC transporter permease [Spirillospora sp. NPDC050679]
MAERRAVPMSRFRFRDLLAESFAGVLQRPGRSVLTMLGTVLGIGAFVAVLGLTSTAGGQIDKRFTVLAATQVDVRDVGGEEAGRRTGLSFPADAAARVERLNGVVRAGLWWNVPLRKTVVSATAGPVRGDGPDGAGLGVLAAEPGALAAMRPVVSTGVLYGSFHQRRRDRVAVLGAAAAARLGITRVDAVPAVFVNGVPYTVTGIVSDVRRHAELLSAVVIPTSTALRAYGEPRDDPRAQMIIETRLGAAPLVAGQAPLALRPDRPAYLKAVPPPDPRTLRSAVSADFGALFLLLAAISLVIGAVGIANTTLVAVLERVGEIGLRRSLGARPRHIAAQFLAESTALGTLGGLIGTALGVAVVVGIALANRWTAVLEPWAVLPAPLAGSLVGLLAGAYPALRAAWIEPIEALRR